MMQSRLSTTLFLSLVVLCAVFFFQYRHYRLPPSGDDIAALEPFGDERLVDEEADSGRDIWVTNDVRHTIPLKRVVSGGVVQDGIPSIDAPMYESVWVADQYLDDAGYGLAVEVGGNWRFYPYQVLVWHEVVNDVFAGEPLIISYCPLCATGIVYERTVGNEVLAFGTSGQLYNSNVLMYDQATESLWSQALGEAVIGELAGTALVRYPALMTTWADFKSTHPSAEVLSRETGFDRDYTRDPYDDYVDNQDIWFPLTSTDARVPNKTLVYGVVLPRAQKAYPEIVIKETEVINDVIGDVPVLVLWDADEEAARVFERTQDGVVLTFEKEGGRLRETTRDQLWGFDGVPLSGDRSTSLRERTIEPSFWFSWAAHFPETEVYTLEK